MEAFAARYQEENPGVFSCSDTAWVLAFGLMMLNTDMYNRNIKVSCRGGGGQGCRKTTASALASLQCLGEI